MRGRLTGYSLNRDGSQNVTVTVAADFGDTYDELKDAEIEIEIKKAANHRSLQANAYAWVLIDEIAKKTGIKKSEIYRAAIREIGGVSRWMMMQAEAVETFRQIWEKQGLGNQVEVVDVDENSGLCELLIWFGSSTYDTRQMSALLDSLIQDAEALGIPTITSAEEEKMLSKWARKKGQSCSAEGVNRAEGPRAAAFTVDFSAS